MIGGWRFTRPQEGRRKTTSPLASSRSVTLALRAVHPTIFSIHPFIHPSCEKTTGQMQYTVSPVNLIHHIHVFAALYLHQIQQGPELPRNPLAPDGWLWLCSQPADEENLHGRSSGSTGWEFTLRNVNTNVRLNPLLDLNEGVEDMYGVYWVSYCHSHIYTEQSECYFSFSLKFGRRQGGSCDALRELILFCQPGKKCPWWRRLFFEDIVSLRKRSGSCNMLA